MVKKITQSYTTLSVIKIVTQSWTEMHGENKNTSVVLRGPLVRHEACVLYFNLKPREMKVLSSQICRSG
jgi:hypothetical protein